MKTRLSVNINKVALIRNSRGDNYPDLVAFAQDCERFGAEGITVHPRPDERHVKFSDLQALKDVVTTEFNVEGYPSEKFIQHVLKVRPHQVTLVPDKPEALTSNSGWNTVKDANLLKEVVTRFKEAGIRVSLFLNAEDKMVEAAKETGTDRIEFYTGSYAKNYHEDREKAVEPHVIAGKLAVQCGLGINAGHDLNLDNLNFYMHQVPNLLEVSIGHAIIVDALCYGIHNTIQMYLRQLNLQI